MRTRHNEIRKELIGMILLPLPVIVYVVGRFVLGIQNAEYAAYVAAIILFVELLLLKTDMIVVRKGTRKGIHFSLTRKKAQHRDDMPKSHVKKKQKRVRHKKRYEK